MDKESFLLKLNESITNYLAKTNLFNAKKTILFCTAENKDACLSSLRENSCYVDEIILIKEGEFCKYIQNLDSSKNYFISYELVTDELYSYLLSKINKDNLYIGPTAKAYFDLYEKRQKIFDSLDDITEVYNSLADQKSRTTFLNIITRLCLSYQFHFYYETEDFPQYFSDNFKYSKDEVFLDAGVCDGQNIIEFIDIAKEYQKIYGIEADTENFLKCKRNLLHVPNLKLLNNALHSCSEKLSFFSSLKTGKKGNAHVQPGGDISVDGIAGDEFDIKPTFIKMDIEGSEKDAIYGLKNTIQETAPKLAICIYHFQTDFWEIPLLIKKLNPRYSLKIRNHEKMNNLLESVCYAYIGER